MSDSNNLLAEVREDVKALAQKMEDLRVEFARVTESNKQITKLEAELSATKAKVEDLQRFRGWLIGVVAGVGFTTGAAGHLITRAFETPPARAATTLQADTAH